MFKPFVDSHEQSAYGNFLCVSKKWSLAGLRDADYVCNLIGRRNVSVGRIHVNETEESLMQTNYLRPPANKINLARIS